MAKKKIILNANKKVIEFIKSEVAAKKERHKKMMESMDPKVIDNLQKMKKIEY